MTYFVPDLAKAVARGTTAAASRRARNLVSTSTRNPASSDLINPAILATCVGHAAQIDTISTGLKIPWTSSYAQLTRSDVYFDLGSWWSTNFPTRITVVSTGIYSIVAHISAHGITGTWLSATIQKNSDVTVSWPTVVTPIPSGHDATINLSYIIKLFGGDYLEVYVQTSDNSGTIPQDFQTDFCVAYLGPLTAS
ncbi:MAG: hypothetical protein ACYCQK_01410 [Acidiferrobacteraceae bacterium]